MNRAARPRAFLAGLALAAALLASCTDENGGAATLEATATATPTPTPTATAPATAAAPAATALAAFTLFSEGSCGVACGEVTGTVGIVHTPFYYALGASMTAYSLLLASRPLPGRGSAEPGGDGPATRSG